MIVVSNGYVKMHGSRYEVINDLVDVLAGPADPEIDSDTLAMYEIAMATAQQILEAAARRKPKDK